MEETQTGHFWVGHFRSEEQAADYFAEIWDEEDEDREHTPLSAFALDQGKKWYDHDFLEYGFSGEEKPIEDLVAGYSYSDQWAAEVARRAATANLPRSNLIVFIEHGEIDQPQSVEGEGYWLHYLGTITYRI
jgi:hypothetical protein